MADDGIRALAVAGEGANTASANRVLEALWKGVVDLMLLHGEKLTVRSPFRLARWIADSERTNIFPAPQLVG